jgi:hypothetical protein
MPAPVAIAAGAAIRHRRQLPGALLALLGLLAVLLVLLAGVFGAIFGLQPAQTGYGPSATARAEIPAAYLRLYREAGARYGIDPWILAGIGAVETDHGRSTLAACTPASTRSAAAPTRCSSRSKATPAPGTATDVTATTTARPPPTSPPTRSPPPPRYLHASDAPADYHAALFAYNHADWYVAEILAKAATYRGRRDRRLPIAAHRHRRPGSAGPADRAHPASAG